jgi:hypothetical protein
MREKKKKLLILMHPVVFYFVFPLVADKTALYTVSV